MKTIKEWLSSLSEPHKTKALKYAKASLGRAASTETEETLFDALAAAFVWEETREGNEYWRAIASGRMPKVTKHHKQSKKIK